MSDDTINILEQESKVFEVKNQHKQKNKVAIVLILIISLLFGGIVLYLNIGVKEKTETQIDIASVANSSQKMEHVDTSTQSETYREAFIQNDINRAKALDKNESMLPGLLGRDSETPKEAELPKEIAQIPLNEPQKEPVNIAVNTDTSFVQQVDYTPPMDRQSGFTQWLAYDQFSPGRMQIVRTSTKKEEDRSRTIEEIAEGGPAKIVITPGEMLYGVMEMGITSTQPDTPAVAQIVSGKYSGAKLIGGWRAGEDSLRVQFNKIVFEDPESGETITESITAFAVNPETYFPGVLSDINYHTLERYVKLAASSFMEGLGEVKSAGGTTYTYGNDNNPGQFIRNYSTKDQMFIAGGHIASKLGSMWANDFNKPPTIKLNPGHPIGIAVL